MTSLARRWRDAAETLRRYGGDLSATALEACADALEEALSQEAEAPLTLTEAADRSGYSTDHLGRLVREGRIPNAGRPGAPRIAAGDIPQKAGVEPPHPGRDLSRQQIVRSAIESGD